MAKVSKAKSLDVEINGKKVYATETGLKFRNSRERSPFDFMLELTKGEKRALRKALDKAGLHKLSQQSL